MNCLGKSVLLIIPVTLRGPSEEMETRTPSLMTFRTVPVMISPAKTVSSCLRRRRDLLRSLPSNLLCSFTSNIFDFITLGSVVRVNLLIQISNNLYIPKNNLSYKIISYPEFLYTSFTYTSISEPLSSNSTTPFAFPLVLD